MIEGFEYEGIWWLPADPKKQISGTLKFNPYKGATLDLIGSFKDARGIKDLSAPEIILGISSNGKKITLYRCYETKSSLSVPGLHISSYYIDTIFMGVHFQKVEDIRFRNLSIHYSNLDEWSNISGFNIEFTDGMHIDYKPPKSVQATINDDLKIFIDVSVTYPTMSVVQKEATIKQETYIRIEPSKEKTLKECLKIMQHIQNFLSLGVMEPVHPLIIKGETEANKTQIEKNDYYPPVNIFYALSYPPDISKTILPFDMLFTFRDINNQFERYLKNWFEKVELLEPVYNLYFGTLYNPHMYVEQHFLSLTEALEIFHRRTSPNGGKYLSEDDYKKIYQAIIKSIPKSVNKDHKQSLKNKLKYGHEYSLRRRLKELFEKHNEIFKKFVQDKDSFINTVKDSRNYLIHYDPELKEKAATGKELYRLTIKLKILLEICLLVEIGFSIKEIDRAISNNRKYQYELRNPWGV